MLTFVICLFSNKFDSSIPIKSFVSDGASCSVADSVSFLVMFLFVDFLLLVVFLSVDFLLLNGNFNSGCLCMHWESGLTASGLAPTYINCWAPTMLRRIVPMVLDCRAPTVLRRVVPMLLNCRVLTISSVCRALTFLV